MTDPTAVPVSVMVAPAPTQVGVTAPEMARPDVTKDPGVAGAVALLPAASVDETR